jgi:serine protease Do
VSSKVRSLVLPDEGFYGQIFSVDSPSSTIQSGWPALNLNGQVVGILGQASTHLYLSEDEKVVLSSNQLQQITEILAQGKTIERGYLGLQLQPITADLATALRLSSADGALVSEVMAGSPAEVAGLLAGDIIKKLDQQMVKRHEQIRLIISELRIGKAITMEIERKGQTQSMSVIPLAHPLQFAVELNQEAQKFYTLDASQRSPLDGVEVTEFKEKALSKIRATELNQFMINRIDYQQTLASAPIEPGTFLLEIDGEKFSTLQEFTALHLKTQGRKVVVLRIESRGKKSYVTLKNNL